MGGYDILTDKTERRPHKSPRWRKKQTVRGGSHSRSLLGPVLMMPHNKQTYPVHVRLVFVAPRLALASSFQAGEKNQSSPKPIGGFARPGRMAMSSLQAVTLPRCPCAPAVAFKLPAAQPMKPPQLPCAIFPPVKWKEAMHRNVALGRPTAVAPLKD